MLDGISNFERKRVKTWSTAVFTVHQHSAEPRLCFAFLLKLSRKTLYDLCKSCRGEWDLQPSYSPLYALLFNFLEKTLSRRVDRLKNCLAALQSAAGAPGVLPAWLRCAPRAGHRTASASAQARLPTASSREPLVPLRADLLGTRAVASGRVPRRTASCAPPSGPSPAPLHTWADVRRRTKALTPGVPSPSPSYKNRTTSCSRPPLLAGILSARCSRGRPPLALLAAVQCRPAAPHGLLYPPAPPRPLPGRSTAEPKAFRGQAPGHRRPAITGGFPTRLRPQIGECEPLNLLHPSPGRIPHRSGSIPASCAGRPPQGPHCKTKVLFEGLPAIGNSNSKSAFAVSCKLHRKS
jgi:hypothetical protein